MAIQWIEKEPGKRWESAERRGGSPLYTITALDNGFFRVEGPDGFDLGLRTTERAPASGGDERSRRVEGTGGLTDSQSLHCHIDYVVSEISK